MASGAQDTGFPPMTASLLETGMYSDLTIKCRDRSWRAHKLIVCLQSKPLAAAVNGEFLEAKTGVVVLSVHDPHIVNCMIKFMYTGDYSIEKPSPVLNEESSPKTEDDSDVNSDDENEEDSVEVEVLATQLFGSRPSLFSFSSGSFGSTIPLGFVDPKKSPTTSMSDATYSSNLLTGTAKPQTSPMFGATNPASLSSGTTKQQINTTSSSKTNMTQPLLSDILTHTAVYLFADEKDIPGLKILATKKYEEVLPTAWNTSDFCLSLKQIFEGTPETDRMLWDVAITYAGANAKTLMDRGEFVSLWKEHGEIGYEMWKAYAKLASLPAPPVLLKPTGCPSQGVEHARFVVKGRRTTYWCESCRKGFE